MLDPSVATATPSAMLRPFFLDVKLKPGVRRGPLTHVVMNPDAGASIVGLLLARSEAGEPVRLYVALAPPAQQRGAPTCALVRDFAIGNPGGGLAGTMARTSSSRQAAPA